jgi:uncharacterized protein YukE
VNNFTMTIEKLTAVGQVEKLSKRGVMAQALARGLSTLRSSRELEHALYDDLDSALTKLTDSWDGDGFIGGALSHANKQYRTW